nr:hypothetical protein RTCK_02645 [Rhizobium sp. TCK]
MSWLNTAFIAGAIGGLSPELARLLVRAQTGEFVAWLKGIREEPWFSIAVPVAGSFGIMFLLALIGGLVAHYVREEQRGKAFILGIGAPAFLLSTAGAVPVPKENTKNTSIQSAANISGSSNFLYSVAFSTAYAQVSGGEMPPSVILDITGIANACDGCSLTFHDRQGDPLGTRSLQHTDRLVEIAVPAAAATGVITGVEATNDARFSLEEVQEGSAVNGASPRIEVYRDRNYVNDFRFLLGDKGIQPFDIQLKSATAGAP